MPKKNDSIVILCHGYGSNKDTEEYKLMEKEFSDNGISTFRFDFHGCGESKGKFDFNIQTALLHNVTDLQTAIDFLEVFAHKKGYDCDSYGILEYYLIREIFKQLNRWEEVKHRLKCVVGHVHNTDKVYTYAGLHFYLIWLHSNGEWQTVETTFYRERAIINFGKTPHKLNQQYSLISFTFNEDWSWAQNSLLLDRLDFEKK